MSDTSATASPMALSLPRKLLVVYLRLTLGWIFLYAGLSQVLNPSFTAAHFLQTTKTFHAFFTLFTRPDLAPVTDFLVQWGHTLIGLSLISGLLVRLSAPFGCLLMGTYYLAHMDFPYIETKLNFLVDYHLVYVGVLIALIMVDAGRVWGLDGLVGRKGVR